MFCWVWLLSPSHVPPCCQPGVLTLHVFPSLSSVPSCECARVHLLWSLLVDVGVVSCLGLLWSVWPWTLLSLGGRACSSVRSVFRSGIVGSQGVRASCTSAASAQPFSHMAVAVHTRLYCGGSCGSSPTTAIVKSLKC